MSTTPRGLLTLALLGAGASVSLYFNVYNVTYAIRSRLIARAAAAVFEANTALTPVERVRRVVRWSCWSDYVTPRDLDWNMHMNNAKYLRKCDLARIKLFGETGVTEATRLLS